MAQEIAQTPGRVVWHELMSTDPETSQAFYSELLGWNIHEVDMGPAGTYRMINNGAEGIGGIASAPAGAPAHWLAYANVPDVDAALAAAEAGGGSVVMPGTDIPGVGRFGILRDPAGATIAPFKSVKDDAPEREGPPPAGAFCWEELLTTDTKKAETFYGTIFGWKGSPMDPQNPDAYTVFNRPDGTMEGGTMVMPPEAEAPPCWISYVMVDDVDATAAKAAALGGKVWKEPADLPNIGRFAVLADPTGATFAVFTSAQQPA